MPDKDDLRERLEDEAGTTPGGGSTRGLTNPTIANKLNKYWDVWVKSENKMDEMAKEQAEREKGEKSDG